MTDMSEATSLKSLTHLLYSNIEAVLMTSRNLHTPLFRTADDFISISHAHSHWLLDDAIDTMVDAPEGDLGMETTLRRNTDKLWFALFKHELIVSIAFD